MLDQIARELHLAKSTVSMCLSGNALKYKIKAETIANVCAYAAQLGYVPNRMAQRLSQKGLSPVGIMLRFDSCTEKRLAALQAAVRQLSESGRDYLIYHYSLGGLAAGIAELKGYRIQEVLCYSAFDFVKIHEQENISDLLSLSQGMELFFMDTYFPVVGDFSWPSRFHLYGFNRQALYNDFFRRFVDAGIELFVIEDEFCVPAALSAGISRDKIFPLPEQGWSQYLSENIFDIGIAAGELIVERIAGRRSMIVVRDDRRAAGIMDVLLRKGCRIPEDALVIGFDNIEAAPFFRVPLTSVDLPFTLMTHEVIDGIIKNKKLPRQKIFPLEMVWRTSCPEEAGLAPIK
jgi:DNA-binding LacI/PurR family transcriptional regulator